MKLEFGREQPPHILFLCNSVYPFSTQKRSILPEFTKKIRVLVRMTFQRAPYITKYRREAFFQFEVAIYF